MSFVAVTVAPDVNVDKAAVERAVLAVDAQALEFSKVHGCDYTPVMFFSWDVLEKLEGDDLDNFAKNARLLTIENDIGEPGALGFHDDVRGVIYARVQFGAGWTETLSHEVLEEMLDPTCDQYVDMGDGRAQALEACDRVECDNYLVNGVAVSNYLLPAAFEPGSNGPWDKLGVLKAWDGMSGGGYTIVRDADGQVQNVFGHNTERAARVFAEKRGRASSRVMRRMGAPQAVA